MGVRTLINIIINREAFMFCIILHEIEADSRNNERAKRSELVSTCQLQSSCRIMQNMKASLLINIYLVYIAYINTSCT